MITEREHIVNEGGTFTPCWCEPGVYHITREEWEATEPLRRAVQDVMAKAIAALDAAVLGDG